MGFSRLRTKTRILKESVLGAFGQLTWGLRYRRHEMAHGMALQRVVTWEGRMRGRLENLELQLDRIRRLQVKWQPNVTVADADIVGTAGGPRWLGRRGRSFLVWVTLSVLAALGFGFVVWTRIS